MFRPFLIGAAVGCVGGVAGYAYFQNSSKIQPQRELVSGKEQDLDLGVPFHLSQRAREILKYGSPGTENLKFHQSYVLSYNRQTRNANWTAQHLSKRHQPAFLDVQEDGSIRSPTPGDRSHSSFRSDPSEPRMFQTRPIDYAHSGYDKGHLVPAADARHDQESMDETFLLTNISPQVGGGFNRTYWNRFELFTRRLTSRFDNVYVITGPLYLPQPENWKAVTGNGKKDLLALPFNYAADAESQTKPGEHNASSSSNLSRDPRNKWFIRYEVIGQQSPPVIAVPTHFFKAVLCVNDDQKTYATGAFVLPNHPIPGNKPLDDFRVPLELVEQYSGLSLFRDHPSRSPVAHNTIRKAQLSLCDNDRCVLPHLFIQSSSGSVSGSKRSKDITVQDKDNANLAPVEEEGGSENDQHVPALVTSNDPSNSTDGTIANSRGVGSSSRRRDKRSTKRRAQAGSDAQMDESNSAADQ